MTGGDVTAGRAVPVASGEDLLTVAEVAAVLRVSRMTVYRLVEAGTLPAARIGRSLRIPRPAVDGYLRDAFGATA